MHLDEIRRNRPHFGWQYYFESPGHNYFSSGVPAIYKLLNTDNHFINPSIMNAIFIIKLRLRSLQIEVMILI